MKIALIYMASGFGSRFGKNKLLEDFEGIPLYLHGLRALILGKSLLEQEEGWQVRIYVVSQYEEIRQKAAALGVRPVENPDSKKGITASLVHGTREAEGADLYVYCVADQPRLRGETLAAFLQAFAASGKGMGCLTAGGRRGNPAAFRKTYRDQLLGLTGDRGGRQLMERYGEDLWLFEADSKELADVDLKEDIKRV